jgi:ATP-dependent DNA ligase
VSPALSAPLKPQLALSRRELPEGEDLVYEVKLDGFRCIAFRDGEDLYLQSRTGKPLGRYFPELILPRGRYVLDGEIIVRGPRGHEDFDALGQRVHPAASRVERLAAETPAVYVAFDLLALDGASLLELSFDERRSALERLFAAGTFAGAPVELIESSDDPARARHWLATAEGAIAKERSAPYRPGERKGMAKVKRLRTIDAVLAGWRPGKEAGTVGALILALYESADPQAKLRVVGHCSGLTAAEKRRLVDFLAPFQTGARGTTDPSRWSAGKDLEWIELRPELVVEIDFDHVSGGRIRHGAKLRRWREDKDPRECLFSQLS